MLAINAKVILALVLWVTCAVGEPSVKRKLMRHSLRRPKSKSVDEDLWRINWNTALGNTNLPRRLDTFTYDSAHLPHDRNLMVHLFEWKWDDIAAECPYLAENGFGAVQISPPTAHVFDKAWEREDVPWYFRYQPTSYALNSRSGTEAQLKRMIDTCNASGVRILVDIVLNHMSTDSFNVDGKHNERFPRSTDGSAFKGHAFAEEYPGPGAGYRAEHFNDGKCNAYVDNYNDRYNVQYCKLVSLVDLDQSNPYVQDRMVALMNRLIDMGVMGFRMDASKHMLAHDMAAFLARIKPLNSKIFGKDREPFIVHEVISYPNEVIQASEYLHIGRVKNFFYGRRVTDAIRNWAGRQAWDLMRIHESNEYGNLPSHQVLVFLDNHDNQRYETMGHITHKDEWEYRLAAAFMMAHTYGVPRLMSSYAFNDVNQGPPNVGAPNYETRSPNRGDGGCDGGWVCEHRWHEIRRMAKWRSQMRGSAMALLHYQHGNCFGFARLDRGYFAFNNDRNNECVFTADTALPPGTYCNVFAQDFDGSKCAPENRVTVDSKGKATIKLYKSYVVALSIEACVEVSNKRTRRTSTASGDSPSPAPRAASKRRRVKRDITSVSTRQPSARQSSRRQAPATPSAPKRPTVVFINVKVGLGQKVFLRGGRRNAPDCHMRANEWNKCAIPIRHLLEVARDEPNVLYDNFAMWSQHDRFLDFHGAEHSQGTVSGDAADGTPTVYTTNRPDSATFSPLNAKYGLGDDHWLVAFEIDCARDPTFSAKGYIKLVGYEPGADHTVHCGRVNLLIWGTGETRLLD